MGNSHTISSGFPIFTNRTKWGIITGALVGGLLLRPVNQYLALAGWVVGGFIGAEMGRYFTEESVHRTYSFTSLCFSVIVVSSEILLLTVLTQADGLWRDLLVAGIGLITLGMFLRNDDFQRSSYQFMLFVGLFGLLTLSAVPFVTGTDGRPPQPEEPPTPEPPTDTPVTPGPPTDAPSTPKPADPYDPHWAVSIEATDNRSVQFYLSNWSFQPETNLISGTEGDSKITSRSTLNSSTDTYLHIEPADSRLWTIRWNRQRQRAATSGWMFIGVNASENTTEAGVFAQRITISDSPSIKSISVTRYLPLFSEVGTPQPTTTPTQPQEMATPTQPAGSLTPSKTPKTDTTTAPPLLASPSEAPPDQSPIFEPLIAAYAFFFIIGGVLLWWHSS